MTDATAAIEPQVTDALDWPRLDACFDTHPMRVEELEEDGCFVVRAELPGIEIANLDVRIREHALEIRARREQVRSATHHGTRHSEFRYGRYWRMLTLPAGARESEVAASYRDGILEVRVPLGGTSTADETRVPVTTRADTHNSGRVAVESE
jgi:HSP20 family protein